MTDAYVVQMALVPHYTIPVEANRNAYIEAAEAGMDTRFTPATRRQWSQLVYAGTLNQAQLAGELNKLLETSGMLAVIAPDFTGNPADITGVVGVSNGTWTPGGGGFHEGVSTVQVRVNGGAPVDWEFTVSSPSPPMDVTVRCWCRWVRRTILP